MRQPSWSICNVNFPTGFDRDIEILRQEEDEGSTSRVNRMRGEKDSVSQLLEINNAYARQVLYFDRRRDVPVTCGSQMGSSVDQKANFCAFLSDVEQYESNLLENFSD